MAPEVCTSGRYGLKADVYSFGLLLWHLCTLKLPFGSRMKCENHTDLIILVRVDEENVVA